MQLTALLAATFVGPPACAQTDEAAETSIEEVRDWPAAYMGKVITAVGEVEERHAAGSFTLDGKGTWWNDEILVVVPREQVMDFEDGAEVRVTGEIMNLVIAEIERDYGVDLDPAVETEFRDKPILVARNVTLVEGG